MVRRFRELAFALAVALLALGGVGFAHASVLELDRVIAGGFVPSQTPTLLGPINELGRNGWQCVPERAALAKHAREAELPQDAER